MENGAASFSVRDEQTGELREAYADDLTDGQLKFLFHARQERERLKKEKAEQQGKTSL